MPDVTGRQRSRDDDCFTWEFVQDTLMTRTSQVPERAAISPFS